MYGERWSSAKEIYFMIIPIVIILSSFITFITFLFAKMIKSEAFASPLNLSLLFSHMIDGWTSYLAVVDPFKMGLDYGEKHPLPLFLMERLYGFSYPLLKFVIVIAIIYAIDIYLKKELQGRLSLTNLIKFFILILGFSPGLRDMLRIAMGI